MNYLVLCPCGHSLERHDAAGCRGRDSWCECENDAGRALEAAINDVRSTHWYREQSSTLAALPASVERNG